VRTQSLLRWIFSSALFVLGLSVILYVVLWFVGLNEASDYQGHASPTTESWLRIASFGIGGGSGSLFLLWLIAEAAQRRAGSSTIDDSHA
jgi:hypothetical protein